MYQTRQKKILIDFFEKNPHRQYSAKEISDEVCLKSAVGKSTVYRLIEKMVDEGVIRRFRGENAKSVVYQYVGQNHECDRHFHLKCTNCGLLVHLECDYMRKLNEHIVSHHNFNIDTSKTILYGLCEKCGNGEM